MRTLNTPHLGAVLFKESSSCFLCENAISETHAVHILLLLLYTKELGCPHPPPHALHQKARLYTTSFSCSSVSSHPHAFHHWARLSSVHTLIFMLSTWEPAFSHHHDFAFWQFYSLFTLSLFDTVISSLEIDWAWNAISRNTKFCNTFVFCKMGVFAFYTTISARLCNNVSFNQ